MNLAQNIERSQRLFPDKPALIFDGKSVTYRELNEMSNRVANGLSELGIYRGDRVALFLPNIPPFVAAYLGIQKIGAVPVSINSALKAEEVKYILKDSGALILITTEVLRANIPAGEISQLKYILIAEGDAKTDRALSELMANASPTALAIDLAPDDPAALLYTSGTTGFPKGATLSHGNLVSNIRTFVDTVGTHPDDRILLFLPASHSYGQTSTLFPCLEVGATLVLQRELEIEGILKSIVDNGVTTFFGVSTIYTLLYEKASAEQMRTIRRYVSGGAPLPLELAKKWRDKFGVSINEEYGSTETSLICFNRSYQPGSVGSLLEGVEVKLIDSETGQQVKPGELGEVVVRGPNVMLGYWNRPAETAQVLKEGWFHTGDIGRTDEEGYFYLVDRIKDMVNVGGLKVYPSEVENILYQHPAVAEVAVYGVPEPLLGEQVIASIIPKSGVLVPAEEIVAFCRQNLADFKVPSLVELVDSLPKGRTGKILKKVLREQWRPRSSMRDESSNQNAGHRSPESIKKWISDWLETELALEPETIETDSSFVNYGLNSTLAVMLAQDLSDWLGQAMEPDLEISLSTTLAFNYPTIDQLTTFLLETIDKSVIAKQTDQLPSSSNAPPERDNDKCEEFKEGLQLPKGHTHDEEVYPLSYGQRALWFLYQLTPENAAYNTALTLRIRSALDIHALQNTFQALINRHPCLRTTFSMNDGEPLQKVHQYQTIRFEQIDASTWSWDELNSRIVETYKKPFNLEQGPVLRVSLFTRTKEDQILLLTIHHIVFDGWSQWMLIEELGLLYPVIKTGSQASLPLIKHRYADYVHWQRKMVSSAKGEHLFTYWEKQLAGELPVLNLPTDHPRPSMQTYHGASVHFCLTETLTQQLKELAKTEDATLFTVLLAIYQILLYRYTGQEDICVGSPTTGRTQGEFAKIAGYFMNMVVLRTVIKGDFTFETFLRKIRQTVLEALDHQDYPFPLLVERLQPDRDFSRSPLFQVSFVLQNPQQSGEILELFASGKTGVRVNLGGIELEPFEMTQQEGQFDLALEMMEAKSSVAGTFNYNTDLFESATITRMVGHFQTLLEGIVANPLQPIQALPLLTKVEQQQLKTWNDTATDSPQDKTIVDLFEQQVEKTPSNIAVGFENQQLTYQQLNDKANQLAHHLVVNQAEISSNNPLIAIAVERSFSMIIGLLGILKAGGAYVPIDPSLPPARIRYMLNDSAAPLLLTQSHLKKHLLLDELEHDCVVVCLDEADLTEQPTENPAVNNQVEDLAYVIYTSGSTGMPKGAMVEHRGMLNHIDAKIDDLKLSVTDVIAHTASLTFDISVWQAFTLLSLGGRIQVFSEQTVKEPRILLDTVLSEGITILEIVPSLLRAVLQEINDSALHPDLSSLRWMILTGEALPPDLCIEWFAYYPEIPLFNAYGPTECSDDVAHHPILKPPAAQITQMPIGKPINNMRLYVLDKHLQLLPVGIAGELYVAGIGVGRGYWNAPEKTVQAFIINPFSPGESLYKTGDLARWLPDGNLEYLGRIDYQVKLRGFRIELGEIESVLSQHPAVKDAVVILYEADDNKRLVAYITTDSEPNELVASLTETLIARLPDYMIPSHFTVLDRLPLTPNGKIDRQALPAPDLKTPNENTLPRDAIELQLLGVWETVLDIHPLGIHDNFFELGGHSLLAMKLMSHIQQQCGVRLPVSVLFQSPTVATLAQQLRQDTTPLLTNLVPIIQTKGFAPPVYCLPGAVGSVMYLYPLASYLGQQQPFYGLQTPGRDGSTTPETVENLAKYHLQALQQQQPSGPYQLIGHSSGGRVAFEMAWQLERQGETVALLAILDTNAPDLNQPNPIADYTALNWLADIVSVFEEQTGIDLNLSLEHLQTLPDLETAYTQVMQAFQQRHILFAPKAAVDELKALVNTYRITVQAHVSYQIPGKIHCPIHLFRASEQTPNIEFKDTREAWGWSECTHAKVKKHWVPGTHESMMTRPHVKTLADKLSQFLTKC
jgi:amino acid adenylation domain-containing protein